MVFEWTCRELAQEMARRCGKGLYHAAAVYREIFKKGNVALTRVPELSGSPSLARWLKDELQWPSCRVVARHEDEVLKFVSSLADGHFIESVIIPSGGRTTLCVSSQVGCRMGCRFCVTGTNGFVRHLSVQEIVWQVYAARFELERPVHNIVFMGMGEPLDNFDNVLQAVRVMNDQRGFDIAHRRITISTAGHAEGIGRLAASNVPNLRLAVSLNAPNDALRSRLMPINRKYPLGRLKQELLTFPLGRDGVIFVEYVLLAGVNDSLDHARELARYLEGLAVRVNVIAFNGGGSGAYRTPEPHQVHRFCGWLADRRIFVRPRRARGGSIMAACGQLGASMGGGGLS